MKRITKATIKSFIRKNSELYINVRSSFDGMTDGLMQFSDGFLKVAVNDDLPLKEHTLGIDGAWFANSSRDYFHKYEDDDYSGYDISNCCGHFIIAIKNN